MLTIQIAGIACIVLGAVLAIANSTSARTPIPCVHCGKLLMPPLYACRHAVGNGRGVR